jgi:hypothetical protein
MYDETNVPGPEFRVRPVVRYVVTRFCHPYIDHSITIPDNNPGTYVPGGSEVLAEVPSEQRAFEIAEAMKAAEDKWLGSSESMAISGRPPQPQG